MKLLTVRELIHRLQQVPNQDATVHIEYQLPSGSWSAPTVPLALYDFSEPGHPTQYDTSVYLTEDVANTAREPRRYYPLHDELNYV